MIVIHIVLAIAGLGLATLNFFKPSDIKMDTSYSLAVGTLLSGISLIFINNASVLRTCLTGIVFFGIVTVLNELARHKLAASAE